jgi:hypothetical protein
VSVEAASASVHPGQPALYKISVSPSDGAAGDVTVQISSLSGNSSPALPAPTFTYCGNGDGTQSCALGSMNENQASQLQAQISVPSSAAAGDTVTLVAKVTAAAKGATATGSITGSAVVDVTAVPPTPTPTPTHTSSSSGGHHSGSGSSGDNGSGSDSNTSGSSADTSPLSNLPPLVNSGNPGSDTTGTSPGGLFPTIGPSSGTPGSGGTSHGSKAARPYKATTVADVLPLNPGQLSTQIAGLIVLALGIMLVFARISVRKPRSSEGKQ